MRYGKFELDTELFTEAPDVVRRIMADCIILNAHILIHKEAVEYTALVEQFDDIEIEMPPPDYDLEYDQEKNAVTWVRK